MSAVTESALEKVLAGLQDPALAVSGGVDSLTLAAFMSHLGHPFVVMHATSPAVPQAATLRVEDHARRLGWELTVIDAGEFDDPAYRANPVNRCFYCKTNLYATIRKRTTRGILSGANRDDLGEYRPGLDAAREYDVRHPYVEAGLAKSDVRSLAKRLGLGEIAELPASPCLSSRIETGIRIEPHVLDFVASVEALVGRYVRATTVRCRIRAQAVVIELDPAALASLPSGVTEELSALIAGKRSAPAGLPVRFEAYRNGSAFLVQRMTSHVR